MFEAEKCLLFLNMLKTLQVWQVPEAYCSRPF